MSTGDLIAAIKDIFLFGAAVTTAYVAYRGLEKWKEELSGSASFDVARQFMRSVYMVRDEIRSCRSPFVSASEFPEGYQGAIGNPTTREQGDAWLHVYKNRWQPVMDAIQEFDSATLEAEALWGANVKEAAQELRQLVIRLRASIDAFIRNEYSGRQDFHDREFGVRIRADLNDTEMETDTFSPAIQAAIERIEDLMRPHLGRN